MKLAMRVFPFFLSIPLICTCAQAHATLDLHVFEPLAIFAKPSVRSKVVMELDYGDRVPISPKKYGAWRKVLVRWRGKKRVAWVRSKDIQSSKIWERSAWKEKLHSKPSEEKVNDFYHRATGFGLAYAASYLSWGARSFELSDGLGGSVSSMTSSTFFPQMFVDLAMGSAWSLRGYTSLRSTHFKGKATSDFIGSKAAEFEQEFLSLGLELKFYSHAQSSFWWGFGGEVAQGQSLEVLYDGDQLETSDEDLPFFFILHGTIGYDFQIWGSLFVLPQVRLGAVINQDPIIYLVDGLVGVGYRL